jgi:hypothetical protein
MAHYEAIAIIAAGFAIQGVRRRAWTFFSAKADLAWFLHKSQAVDSRTKIHSTL